MEKVAIYPGTFDPITNGHIDIIERAGQLFDKIIVVIAVNSNKTCLFSEEERLILAKDCLKHLDNVKVDLNKGLTVDYAKKVNAIAIVRGIRAISDYEYEFQIALMNRKLYPEASTLFLLPHEKYTYLNSSIIRELARYKRDVCEFVPDIVAKMLESKF